MADAILQLLSNFGSSCAIKKLHGLVRFLSVVTFLPSQTYVKGCMTVFEEWTSYSQFLADICSLIDSC